jgi:hypothetical protein
MVMSVKMAAKICVLGLLLTVFNYQSLTSEVDDGFSCGSQNFKPIYVEGTRGDEAQTNGEGNETIGGEPSNLTGHELRYPGYNMPSIPRRYYREPPFYVEGIVNISLKSTGNFDPLIRVPDPPLGLKMDYRWRTYGHYLIQFTGPPRLEWRDEIESMGGIFFGYVPKYTYMIQIKNSLCEEISSKKFVRWIGVYHAGYKIDPKLQSMAEDKEPIPMWVVAYEGSNMYAIKQRLRSLGGTDVSGGPFIHLTVSPSKVRDITRIEDVYWIEWADYEDVIHLDM